MQNPVLKEYYVRYLTDVRNLSQASVKHYVDALNNISRYLVSKNLVTENIYEIMDFEQLGTVRDILYADPEFIAQDKRGHQMYSAGLNNYCRFAKGEDFALAKEKVMLLDVPIEIAPQAKRETTVWRSSGIIREQSLEIAQFRCEIDNRHDSFIAARTNHMYMEGHHAIPMHMQPHFSNSLDVYANIICLCPVCHRRIHYGLKDDKVQMMQQIYSTHADRLAQSGIQISKSDFVAIAI